MDFSLIVPHRERIKPVITYVQSIDRTVKDPSKIEIIFILDDNHPPTEDNIKNLQIRYKHLNIKYYIRSRTPYTNKDYYNYGAQYAQGKYIWVNADDLVMLQHHWDERIFNFLETHLKDKKDRIICASIKDNTPKPSPHLPKFPCFPLFSREVLEVLGYILYPKIPTWGADYIAYQIFHPIHRLLEIQDKCYINHISYHTKTAVEDNVSKTVGATFNALKNVPYHNIQRIEKEELPLVREKLLNYIKNHKG